MDSEGQRDQCANEHPAVASVARDRGSQGLRRSFHAALVALHAIMAGQILRMASGPLTTVRVRSGTAGRGCFICRRACGAREDREGHDRALMILVSRVADLTCHIKELNASVVESTAAICNRAGNKDLESFSW